MHEIKLGNNGNSGSSFKIYADDCFEQFDMTEGRWPCYRLRGKPVTPEEAVKIIAKCDNLFSFTYRLKGSVGCSFMRMSYFDVAHTFNDHHGWVHPNGMIAQNYCSGIKIPYLNEILEDISYVAEAFPFLDMIVAVSKWDEMSPVRWDMMWDGNDNYKYYDDEDFTDSLEMGIWIHNRMIEVVDPKRAAELYNEYDRFYDGADRRMFFPNYYRDFAMGTIGTDFLKKCLSVYGIEDADGFIEEGRREKKAFCNLSDIKDDGEEYTICTSL